MLALYTKRNEACQATSATAPDSILFTKGCVSASCSLILDLSETIHRRFRVDEAKRRQWRRRRRRRRRRRKRRQQRQQRHFL